MKGMFVWMMFLCLQLTVKAQTVDVETFAKGMTAGNVQLFDVRTAAEYRTGHLPNALQADYNNKQEFFDRVQYLDKDKPVYIYCLVGGRSAAAAKWMRNNGFSKVIDLAGGVNAWKQAGKPLEGAEAVKQMAMNTFSQSIANGLVLVDVSAEWCPPCRKMEPVIRQLQQQKGKTLEIVKVNGGTDAEVMKNISATILPTFIVYRNGKEVWRKEGVATFEELNQATK
jgi:rhodanese-related sulfurtransferase